MSFISAGNNNTQRLFFNSGTLDFGSNRLVAVESVTIGIDSTIADIYILGSIKRADIARSTLKVTMAGVIKSYAPEMEQAALGSSTVGTPQEIDYLDGQPTLLNPVFTTYDRNNKELQYQLINAIFRSNKLSAKAEVWVQWDFELDAIDIKEVYTV